MKNLILAAATLLATMASAQNLSPLNSVAELSTRATAVQFKNVATGQYIVLKAAPQGGGSLEASNSPDPTPWYFYQDASAAQNNVEMKRQPVEGFNWSYYDQRDPNLSAITWNHAKRQPGAHAWYIEDVADGIFKIKWAQNGEYVQLMPDMTLSWLKGTGPKIMTRPYDANNKHQQWIIEANAKTTTCAGKVFTVDGDKKIWEKRNGKWTHVGDRCNQLKCERRRTFCQSTDGSLWRYNDQAHNWTPANTLLAGQHLNGGTVMYQAHHLVSNNGKNFFYMQENGDLGIWNHNGAQPKNMWSSRTSPGDNYTLHMQTDGNLVVYNTSNQPVWASNTHTSTDARYGQEKYKPVKLVLEDNGQIVLYSATGYKVWDNVNGLAPLN